MNIVAAFPAPAPQKAGRELIPYGRNAGKGRGSFLPPSGIWTNFHLVSVASRACEEC